MSHLKNYLMRLAESSPNAVESVKETLAAIVPENIEAFNFKEHITGLLLGEVQSGKTGQMFGVVSAAADAGFEIFIVLTSPINALQKQTYERALLNMDTFNICDEGDELRFKVLNMRKPALIILKKNTTVLKKWKDTLASTGFCKGRPIFIVDDEADAASLNTEINREEQSAINRHLEHIRNLSTSSFYLQVTATPQSLLLQTKSSNWKPAFVHYFPPGKGYLGGSFFYSKPAPFTNRFTEDDELSLLLKTDEIAEGLKLATETYLVTAAHQFVNKDSTVCNFLIHPSVRIEDHEKIAAKAKHYLKHIFKNLSNTKILGRLENAWLDLKKSKPDIRHFRELVEFLATSPDIDVFTMNSGPDSDPRVSFDQGMNIVVGGNSLGRGVTFKGLQTVYYCRSSKTPQADTFWQHSRMFGYDRDPMLMRVFMPMPLFNVFAEINNSNEVLLKQVQESNLDDIHIMTSSKVRPTRKNVVDQSLLNVLVGGVNYFPPTPDQSNAEILDPIMASYDDKHSVADISLNDLEKILTSLAPDEANEWSTGSFIAAVDALKNEKGSLNLAKLIVRRNRDISQGTGTLLSPDDRQLGNSIQNLPVLTMYRLNGKKENKWDGHPFWIPNIKLPDGKVFYKVD